MNTSTLLKQTYLKEKTSAGKLGKQGEKFTVYTVPLCSLPGSAM